MSTHAASLERVGLPNLVLLGESRLRVLFWDIYDAGLYVTDGIYDPEKPFALSLNYLRGFSGSDITKRSIEEIRRQGFVDESELASWETQLSKIFPTSRGDEIIGVGDPIEGAQFLLSAH